MFIKIDHILMSSCLKKILCKFKTEVQNFGFILTLVNQTLKKKRGFAKRLGARSPQRA